MNSSEDATDPLPSTVLARGRECGVGSAHAQQLRSLQIASAPQSRGWQGLEKTEVAVGLFRAERIRCSCKQTHSYLLLSLLNSFLEEYRKNEQLVYNTL